MSASGLAPGWYWPEKNQTHYVQVGPDGTLWHKWWGPGQPSVGNEGVVGPKFTPNSPVTVFASPGQWNVTGVNPQDPSPNAHASAVIVTWPVTGSVMASLVAEPAPVTSVTSFITVPPSDFAFAVEAAMSSTSPICW